jgi:CheY-like chemotaxis protein/anti-sigma regulatory factor (Ser/Thr protein kinase)
MAEEPKPTVLVVDDSLVDRHKAAGIIAQSLGWRVAQAADGRAALEAVAGEVPSVVLTDLQMPEVDGLALVEALRASHPFLPVVVMTAYGSEEIAVEAIRKGAASYVPKRNLGLGLAETLAQVVAAADRGRQQHNLLRECLREAEAYYVLANDPTLIRAMVARLQDDLAAVGLAGDRRVHVGIALEEALTNALYHGNLEVSSALREGEDAGAYRRTADERRRQPPYRDRRIHVRARLSPAEGVIGVRDEGPGFDPSTLPDPTDPENIVKASGRGLLLIRTFMDEVTFNPTGNEITLRLRRAPAHG